MSRWPRRSPGACSNRKVAEGDKVQKGAVIAVLDTADTELALTRARAERAQADAQLRLLLAGSRPEDIRVASRKSRRRRPTSPQRKPTSRLQNWTSSDSSSCSRRTRARASSSTTPWRGATWRASAPWPPASACGCQDGVVRVKAGARREEIDAARARRRRYRCPDRHARKGRRRRDGRCADRRHRDDDDRRHRRTAPAACPNRGDYRPRSRVGQCLRRRAGRAAPARRRRATLFTDAGGPGVKGTISYISERAEFTPATCRPPTIARSWCTA